MIHAGWPSIIATESAPFVLSALVALVFAVLLQEVNKQEAMAIGRRSLYMVMTLH
jgi:hypothetical protein